MANTVTFSRSVSGAGYLGLDSVTGAYLYTTGSDSNGKILFRSDVEPSQTQVNLWKSVHPKSDPLNSYYNTTTDEMDLRAFPSPEPDSTATPQPDAPNASTVAAPTISKVEETNLREADKIKSDALGTTKKITNSTPNADDGVPSTTGPKSNGVVGVKGKQSGPTALQATQNNAIAAATTPVEIPKPTPNPLHSYATYTYGLTLYVLSAEDFNNLQKADANQLDAWKPTYALISSGGAHQSDRNAAFKDDFYFDNFKLSTIIGLNAMSRGTNAIQLSFTVIEPYGLTLLDRIIDVAQQVGSKNYLAQP